MGVRTNLPYLQKALNFEKASEPIISECTSKFHIVLSFRRRDTIDYGKFKVSKVIMKVKHVRLSFVIHSYILHL